MLGLKIIIVQSADLTSKNLSPTFLLVPPLYAIHILYPLIQLSIIKYIQFLKPNFNQAARAHHHHCINLPHLMT
jgi:hypothetical protein